jgi:enoyl-CoA hydratase/carnithine racemase
VTFRENSKEVSGMEYKELLFEKREKIAKVTFNRPDKLNTLTSTLIDDLNRVLDEIEQDNEVRVAILTGAGSKAFSAGIDLGSPGGAPPGAEEWDRILRKNFLTFLKIWDLSKPVIAAVNGYAIAAGSNLAMICDITIASENARFGEPEVRHMSLSPMLILPWIVNNQKRLHELYYTGDTIDAREAERLGMVSRVVPSDQLEKETWRTAKKVSLIHPLTLKLTKRSIKRTYEIMGFKSALDYHRVTDTFMLNANLKEKLALYEVIRTKGMKAFLEIRDKPFEI